MSPQHVVPPDPFALSVLLLLLFATALGAALTTRRRRHPRIVFGVALVVLALVWLMVNGPYEGPVLWVPLPGHGLTVGDLLSVPAFAVAAVLGFAGARWRPSPPSVTEAARRRAFARVW
jgi:membrane-bound ClpP family serine protease